MMWRLLAIVRFTLVLFWVLFGVLLALFIGLMSNRVFRVVQQSWYRGLLFLLGIRCRYLNTEIVIAEGTLVVSNHISWADIRIQITNTNRLHRHLGIDRGLDDTRIQGGK